MSSSSAQNYDAAVGDGKNLFGKMMISIKSAHTWGNRVRMLKLPLIFTETWLYAGAIANFYYLTLALEEALDKARDDIMVAQVLEMRLQLAPGYEADLAQLYGAEWRSEAAAARTLATDSYCKKLTEASPVELVSAAFILYGCGILQRLNGVIPAYNNLNQGKATQKK
eukprot:gene7882-6996_t